MKHRLKCESHRRPYGPIQNAPIAIAEFPKQCALPQSGESSSQHNSGMIFMYSKKPHVNEKESLISRRLESKAVCASREKKSLLPFSLDRGSRKNYAWLDRTIKYNLKRISPTPQSSRKKKENYVGMEWNWIICRVGPLLFCLVRPPYMFWMSCRVASISSWSILFFSLSLRRSSANITG